MSNLVAIPIDDKEFFNQLVEKLAQEFAPTLSKSQVRKALHRAVISFKADHETFEFQINLMTRPAYSLGLTGKYKGRIHQRSKKGKYYSKRYKKPKDPKKPEQLHCRNVFTQASNAYQTEPESVKELWKKKAKKINQTPRSLYMQQYMLLLHKNKTPPIPFLP